IDFSGTVYQDKDGDGVRDRGEAGIAGRTVYADVNGNGIFDADETSTITDSAGHYFLSVVPGDYSIKEVVPAGWYETTADDTSNNGGDFGSARYASISGSVFRDANRNHKRDRAEHGLAGATVYIDTNNNGWIDAGEKTVKTLADGNWKFAGLTVGKSYNI